MEASQPVPQAQENWWQRRQRWQQWTIGIVGVFILLGIGSAIGESNSSSEEDKLKEEVASLKTELAEAETQTAKAEAAGGEAEEASSEAEEEVAAEVKAEVEEEAEEASKPKSTMDDGTWVRGVDYVVGTYRAPGGSLCYWEQDKKPGGEAAGEGFNSHYGLGEKNILLEITSPYFKTESCGTWELIETG
jgi:hypothetical protein